MPEECTAPRVSTRGSGSRWLLDALLVRWKKGTLEAVRSDEKAAPRAEGWCAEGRGRASSTCGTGADMEGEAARRALTRISREDSRVTNPSTSASRSGERNAAARRFTTHASHRRDRTAMEP